jgi:cytochrome c553
MGSSQLGIALSETEIDQITAFLEALTGDQPQIVYPILPPSVASTPRPKPYQVEAHHVFKMDAYKRGIRVKLGRSQPALTSRVYAACVLFMGVVFGLVQSGSSNEFGLKIVMQGNGKGAVACLACHGMDGAGNAAAGFPRLAGLDAAYMAKQVRDFKTGARSNPIMLPIAQAITEGELIAVSQYYAAQDGGKPMLVGRVDRIPTTLGERLALRGAWDRNIPECVSCHGPGGIGVGPVFPRLGGQHAPYLAGQLRAWKAGTRKNDPNRLMQPIAAQLTDEEIDAVAAYFSKLGQN